MARKHIEVKVPLGFHTPMLRGIETASSTWKRGAPLIFSSGKLAIAGTDPRDIAAIALQDATGVTDAEVIAASALSPGLLEIEISLDSASGLGTRALAQADVGVDYGITVDANGIWYLDVDKVTAGTNTVAVVTALVDPIGAKTSDTPTDTNSGGNRVRAMLLQEAVLTQQAAS